MASLGVRRVNVTLSEDRSEWAAQVRKAIPEGFVFVSIQVTQTQAISWEATHTTLEFAAVPTKRERMETKGVIFCRRPGSSFGRRYPNAGKMLP